MRMTEESSTRCTALMCDIADVRREIAFSITVKHGGEYFRMDLLVHIAAVVVIGHVILVFLESNPLHFSS